MPLMPPPPSLVHSKFKIVCFKRRVWFRSYGDVKWAVVKEVDLSKGRGKPTDGILLAGFPCLVSLRVFCTFTII